MTVCIVCRMGPTEHNVLHYLRSELKTAGWHRFNTTSNAEYKHVAAHLAETTYKVSDGALPTRYQEVGPFLCLAESPPTLSSD